MSDPAAFIRANTRLAAPSAVPELRLWLADELTPLWQATELWLAETNCAPPYWAFAWAGGQALARYCLDRPEAVAGRRVFDLAAGGGIGALAAAKAGASRVTANEIDPLALAAVELNAAANSVANSVANNAASPGHSIMPELSLGDRTGAPLAGYDLILAGDICYERAMADKLLPWLRSLAASGKEVWLADPGRAYLPTAGRQGELQGRLQGGLEPLATYTIPVTRDLESTTQRETTLYKLVGL